MIAGGILLSDREQIPDSFQAAALEAGVSELMLRAWAEKHSGVRPDMAERLLQSAYDLMQNEKTTEESQQATMSVASPWSLAKKARF